MLVIGTDILQHLKHADPAHIKNASFYLTIGAIIPAGEEARSFDIDDPTPMVTLKPRQVAWVVSREIFSIKDHTITALVTLRSTWTKQGLLALDVGMVDPDFEGPIGSIVINFSKNEVPLRLGDEFFRVVFMKHPDATAFKTPRVQTTLRKYITDRQDEIIKGFPATFLDVDPVSDEMITKVAGKIEPKVLDNLMLQVIKQHYGKVGIFLLVVAAVVAATFVGLWSKFGLTDEQVRSLAKTVIEQQVAKPPAKQ